jgi:hypothetical protein
VVDRDEEAMAKEQQRSEAILTTVSHAIILQQWSAITLVIFFVSHAPSIAKEIA